MYVHASVCTCMLKGMNANPYFYRFGKWGTGRGGATYIYIFGGGGGGLQIDR